MGAQVEVRSQATAVVDDFDAALAMAVQQVTALRLANPAVTITPCVCVREGCAGIHYHVIVAGVVVQAATAVEAVQ